ncbi:MAG: ArsR family transcriptional regulator [Candidatus Thorarchaeota archaeon]|jgi:CRISPR locus-related DNA-binding protein
MIQKIIHVAIFDGELIGSTERITIQRSVDGVILVYPYEKQDSALSIIRWYTKFKMDILPVPVNPRDFQHVLSHILEALDDYCMDNHLIEFNIACQDSILTLAASFAAMIIRAPIYTLTEQEVSQIVEIRPAEITTLTVQKRMILEKLTEQMDTLNQSDIARDMELSRSNISRHINTLEKAGYVKQLRKGREKLVQITNLGTTILRHKLLRKRRIWGSKEFHSAEVCSFVG